MMGQTISQKIQGANAAPAVHVRFCPPPCAVERLARKFVRRFGWRAALERAAQYGARIENLGDGWPSRSAWPRVSESSLRRWERYEMALRAEVYKIPDFK